MAITLRPMPEASFSTYRRAMTENFAIETARTEGLSAEAGRELAEHSMRLLLPDGIRSTNHYFFEVMDGDRPVGLLWLMLRPSSAGSAAYVYEIRIDETERRKGFGEVAMRLIEDEARKLGARSLKLHVFAHNAPAQALYEKIGYRVTGLMMQKGI